MNHAKLRRRHRRTGIILAPFLLLQGVSGLILSYGVFTRAAPVPEGAEASKILPAAWNLVMARLHFGPGLIGWIYHSLVGLSLLWMIGSGVLLWFDLWKKNRGISKE